MKSRQVLQVNAVLTKGRVFKPDIIVLLRDKVATANKKTTKKEERTSSPD